MISGTALGPTSRETGSVDPDTGLLTSSPARTRVLYDGSPAPLIFGSVGQSGAIVPYSVSGKPQTQVEVEYAGIRSSPMLLDVAETSPGLFAADFSGRGQGAILNEDGTSNSAANPAPLGSVITLYGTGAGDTSPPGEDGRIVSNPFPAPLLPISVTTGGVPASDICMPALRRPRWRANFGSTCGRRRERLPEINP